MSSFSSRMKKVEKERAAKSKISVEKGNSIGDEVEIASALAEQTESATTTESSTSGDATQASKAVSGEQGLYGEDQLEDNGDKPKFERTIPLDRIRPNPFQHRKTFDQDKLNELAAGMEVHGWIGGGLPVRAHATEANIYELVWGERRWRAAHIAGLKAIPCVVSTYSDDDMIEKGLLENIQREDLSNLEEGQAYVNLLALRTEQGKPRYSIRRLANRIGKDKSYIEERLKYARVPIDIQQLAVDQPDISPRIIHELGELSKILKPEERAPVIEGVKEGKLRIEDVREIRKDVEQQVKNETANAVSPFVTRPTEQQVQDSAPLTMPQMSVATDTSPSLLQEEQSELIDQEQLTPTVVLPSQEVAPVTLAPLPTNPLASVVSVSVFEKTLKRDNEAMERIFQHLSQASIEALTEPEHRVLLLYLKKWEATIQGFIQRLELEEEQ